VDSFILANFSSQAGKMGFAKDQRAALVKTVMVVTKPDRPPSRIEGKELNRRLVVLRL
jgi:hypothetical protein